MQIRVPVPPGARLPNSSVSLECPLQSESNQSSCEMRPISLKAGINLPGWNSDHSDLECQLRVEKEDRTTMKIHLGTVVNTGNC